MQRIYIFGGVSLVLILFSGCKRFDSDKLNLRLIQGEWRQMEIIYTDFDSDSLVYEYPNGATVLTFAGDSCTERMDDLNSSKRFGYEIKDYTLKLDEKDKEPSFLQIMKLTEDSLILEKKYQRWRYLRGLE